MADPRDVESAAREGLRGTGCAALKQIVCQYDRCSQTLTLRGRVSFFYWKQLAQEKVRYIGQVDRVINLVEVQEAITSAHNEE